MKNVGKYHYFPFSKLDRSNFLNTGNGYNYAYTMRMSKHCANLDENKKYNFFGSENCQSPRYPQRRRQRFRSIHQNLRHHLQDTTCEKLKKRKSLNGQKILRIARILTIFGPKSSAIHRSDATYFLNFL